MANIKYPYPRADVTIRVSETLLDLMHDVTHEIGITMQDWCTAAFLFYCDPTATLCPDWKTLDAKIRPDLPAQQEDETDDITSFVH